MSRIFANALAGLEKSDTNQQSVGLCQINFFVGLVKCFLRNHSRFSRVNQRLLALFQSSSSVYKFKCERNSYYVGRPNQRLEIRFGQHLPASIRHGSSDRSLAR